MDNQPFGRLLHSARPVNEEALGCIRRVLDVMAYPLRNLRPINHALIAAEHDGLTGLKNRRGFDVQLQEAYARVSLYSGQVSLPGAGLARRMGHPWSGSSRMWARPLPAWGRAGPDRRSSQGVSLMAMAKHHAGGRDPMVDQDATITDYLDGLLRDRMAPNRIRPSRSLRERLRWRRKLRTSGWGPRRSPPGAGCVSVAC